MCRFTDNLGFFIDDFESGLLPPRLGDAVHPTSAPGPVFEPIDIQTIASASGLQWIFRDAGHPVQIYPAVAFGCPSLAGTPRLAAGTARIIRTDNDLFGDPRAMNTTG